MNWMKNWAKPLWELMFPRYCAACRKRMQAHEQALCPSCLAKLPRTNFHRWEDNPVSKQFWGKFPLGKASAWIYYAPASPYAQMIHRYKYYGQKTLAYDLGRMMAREIQPSGFFDGIDCIVPVPLHPLRFKERGYNQSEQLAKGIASVTGIQVVCNVIERTKNTVSQTHKTPQERIDSMKGVFKAKHEVILIGKHILLVDDVMTTSSTLTACVDAMKDIADTRFSILAMAIAGL